MLGKTHVAVGVTLALAVLRPTSASACLCAVAGGALGGWVCDIDVRDDGRAHDIWQASVMALGIAIVTLGWDAYQGGAALAYVVNHFGVLTAAGAVGLFAYCVVGSHTPHRSFTHSLLGLLVSSLSVAALCVPLAPGFFLGYVSHIALDLLNHRRVRILYPLGKGCCLGLCDSAGKVNKVLLWAGTVGSAVVFAWFLYRAL